MSLAEKTSTLPTHKRQRDLGGENVLFCARMRAKTAKARGEVERTIDPDTAGRVPLGNALAEIGIGGELVPHDSEMQDTVTNPDFVTLDASYQRLGLAERAGVLELALDASDSINAKNSLEKMLVHQMAALHQFIMKLTARMENLAHLPSEWNLQQRNIESCRAANTVARLTTSYQQGMLALQRVRSGGKQQVVVRHTVQHVHVNEGGQAVVTGKIGKGGGGSSAKRGRGSLKK